MGREGKGIWPSYLEKCCAWNVCFGRTESNRRAAGFDVRLDPDITREVSREDLETARHMGTQPDVSSALDRRLEEAVKITQER
jgi:hypothetical protein